jgi:hypothetical protein
LKDFLPRLVDDLVGSWIVPAAKDLLAQLDVGFDVGLLLFTLWWVAYELFMATPVGPLDIFLHETDDFVCRKRRGNGRWCAVLG